MLAVRHASRYANGKSNLTLTLLPPRQARPRGHAVERTCLEERQLGDKDKDHLWIKLGWRGGEERVILPSYGL